MRLLVILMLCLILATATLGKKMSKKQVEKRQALKINQDELDMIADDNTVADSSATDAVQEEPTQVPDLPKDPCGNLHCGAGKQCEIDDEGNPLCVCVAQCPPENDERRKICSNHNETWESDCEVYRMRCLCEAGEDQCLKKKYKHAHVDYYGECREIAACTKGEMEDFPRRMRDWLFNVMKDLANRKELTDDYMQLEKEAEASLGHKWVNAVIWKFCDLDSHPHDRSVSRHELFPIRAPLLAMEHCIAPFLDSCDENDDHQISLIEWGKCLGLEEGEIENKCPKQMFG